MTANCLAVCLSLAAATSYSLMSFFIKLIHHDANQPLIGLVRFTISWLWIYFIISCRVYRSAETYRSHLVTKHPTSYISRAIFTVLSVVFSCLALKDGPMANVMALIMSQALFVPVVEKLLYNVSVDRSVMMSMLIGFVGVLVSLKPNGDFISHGSIWGLLSGISIAISYVNLRTLARHDHPYTIMFIHFSIVLLINIILTIFYWRKPAMNVTWLWLSLMGVCGTAYQEFITRAMGKGSASLVSALQYSSIAIGSLLGWAVWNESPALHVWMGAILIVIGSILTVHFSTVVNVNK